MINRNQTTVAQPWQRYLRWSLTFPLLGLWLGLSGFTFKDKDLAKLRLLYPQAGLNQDLAAVGNGLLRKLPLPDGDAPIINPTVSADSVQLMAAPPAPAPNLQQGTQISVNGRTFPAHWSRWQEAGEWHVGISDTAAMQGLGIELLDTNNPQQQAVRWFSPEIINLPTKFIQPYRYLDVTVLAQQTGWNWGVQGETLVLNLPPARIQNLRQGVQGGGNRIVLELDHPTAWQVSQAGDEAVVMVDGVAPPELIAQYQPLELLDKEIAGFTPPLVSRLTHEGKRVKLHLNLPEGGGVRVWTLPGRLIVDVGTRVIPQRDIAWSSGLRWREKLLKLESAENPLRVTWLELDWNTGNFDLKPIWTNPGGMPGTAPIQKTAQLWQATAAINGGFFNRNNQLPLGAIRRDGQWVSSPILNRGAIAWNDNGEIKIGRLTITETVTTETGKTLPVLVHNSGYVQSGIARYTSAWGTSYTPLTDDEIIVTVQNEGVVSRQAGGKAQGSQFPIPSNGYLLILRAQPNLMNDFGLGTRLSLETTTPRDFDPYPHVLGAGPVLLENGVVVLDALGEKFSDGFNRQAASRSAIATTGDNKLIIATIHSLPGQRGATLPQTAEIMQQLGGVNALNLDGGSSTSLTLGGQLIDRSPVTAARVHNGIGIFLKSSLFLNP
jgi:hypothetical protein